MKRTLIQKPPIERKLSPRVKSERTVARIARPVRIVPPSFKIHDLSDTSVYRTHAYIASPGVFAVLSDVEIVPADMLLHKGVAYKVISVERIENGRAVEVKTVVWERLQIKS